MVMSPVSAIGDTLSVVVLPEVPIGRRVEMTWVVICTEAAFVIIETAVMPVVAFVFPAVVIFKIFVVTGSMLVDAVLAKVVLMVPGLGELVAINVVWLRACVAVVAEWVVVSCVVSVVVGGNDIRPWVVETGVPVPLVTANVVYVELKVPIVVLPVVRLFVREGVVPGTVLLVLVVSPSAGKRVVVIRTAVSVLVSVTVVGTREVVRGRVA